MANRLHIQINRNEAALNESLLAKADPVAAKKRFDEMIDELYINRTTKVSTCHSQSSIGC